MLDLLEVLPLSQTQRECRQKVGDTSETNTKVLSPELILGVVALKTPIQKNHYMLDLGPFPRY